MSIYFDLDGTLVDASERLYKLFQYLVPSSNYTKEEYWKLKRNKISHFEILKRHFNYTEYEFGIFKKSWMDSIEMQDWLSFDVPFSGVTNFLHNLRPHHSLFIVTARQSEENTLSQINEYGWSDLITDVLVTKLKYQKYELIKIKKPKVYTDWLVGDTGSDIQSGKELQLKTAAVLTGFLNREKLLSYNPDIIVNSVVDLTF